MKSDFHRYLKAKASAEDLGQRTAAKWMGERGKEIHPAFGVETQYDPRQKKYITDEQAAIDSLSQVLNTYDANCSPEEPTFTQCSWETVLKTLEEAKKEHTSGTSKSRYESYAMTGMEVACQFTNALPDEYGLGVIKGILGILYQTAKRRGENRARILEAFESIPESILTINLSCRLLGSTPKDDQLREDFHMELLRSMPVLVDILLGNAAWYRRAKGYMSLKISESLKVDEILSEWSRYTNALEKRVTQMRDRLLSHIAYHSAESHYIGVKTYDRLDSFDNRFEELKSIISGLAPTIFAMTKMEISNQVEQMGRSLQAQAIGAQAQTLLFRGWERLEMEGEETPDASHDYLLQNDLNFESEEVEFDDSQPHDTPYKIMTELEVLGLLQVGPFAPLKDLEFILQQSERTTELSLRQVQWLNQMDEFVDWFQSPESSILLVDGHLEAASYQRISPLSIFNASFILNLFRSPFRITLSFFSGLYDTEGAERDEVAKGPYGLIRSLIVQLLSHKSFPQPDLSFLTEEWIEDCRMNNIKALCELFKRLVFQIPADVELFCILDGLVIYEADPLWGDKIDYVAALFQHIARETNFDGMPRVKTLLTFANRSLRISDRVTRCPDVWKHVVLRAQHASHMPLMI